MQQKKIILTILFLTLLGCISEKKDKISKDSYLEYDIIKLQTAMQNNELTSRKLVDYYLQRIALLDHSGLELRSIIEINPDVEKIADALDIERTENGPRGPLHGIPVVIKANIDTGDKMATTAGSLALAHHYAIDDAYIVKELRKSGAIILGKTNLSEWANFRSTKSTSGWSSIGFQTKNPYDIKKNPCGSSSGSAVAVSANLTSVSIGTETDGSVVCPAGINGIVGIKPTLGLVSRDGIIPIAHSQDTAGPMARTVRDAAILLTAISSLDQSDILMQTSSRTPINYAEYLDKNALKQARIGVIRNYSGANTDQSVEENFNSIIHTLKNSGAIMIDPVTINTEGMRSSEYEVLLYEFKADLNKYLTNSSAPLTSLSQIIDFNQTNYERVMPFFDQDIFEMADSKGPLSDQAYIDALKNSKNLARNGINNAFKKYKLDALVAPTNGPAWITDHINGDTSSWVSSSSLAAVSGYPSITVPAGYISGLPVGVSFIGEAFSEEKIINIAYAFEQVRGSRIPPTLNQ